MFIDHVVCVQIKTGSPHTYTLSTFLSLVIKFGRSWKGAWRKQLILKVWSERNWRLNKLTYIIYLFIYFKWKLITLQYCSGFCHILTWISHRCTCVPHPEFPFHLPPHRIPQGHPSASALSTLSHALNLDWWYLSHIIIYIFQCYSLKSSHPRLLPQSPKDCSIHLCFFCCPTYRVIVTISLNSIYMC